MESRAKLLGKYIKKQRKKRHMSMSAMSQICQLSVSHISRIEKGEDSKGKEISPSLDVIERIARSLNISLNRLLVDSGYISIEAKDEDEAINNLIDTFLRHPEIAEQYGIELDNLDKAERQDIYRIISNAIDLVSLKYPK